MNEPIASGPVADFVGAKAAVFIDGKILCLLRDETPGLSHAGLWDLPGGGREGDESGFETLCREIEEEVGLDARAGRVLWNRFGESAHFPGRMSWFFVIELPDGSARDILMGDEGGAWALMPVSRFMALDDAVPSLQGRVALWLEEEASRG